MKMVSLVLLTMTKIKSPVQWDEAIIEKLFSTPAFWRAPWYSIYLVVILIRTRRLIFKADVGWDKVDVFVTNCWMLMLNTEKGKTAQARVRVADQQLILIQQFIVVVGRNVLMMWWVLNHWHDTICRSRSVNQSQEVSLELCNSNNMLISFLCALNENNVGPQFALPPMRQMSQAVNQV